MTLQVWLCWLTGVALGGAGAFLICWGLFSDRLSGSWKKRRCRGCLYDMTSVSGLKCSECGREWRSEAQMRKVRRRWGMASFGVVLTLGAFALNWYAAGLSLGWVNVAPTGVLVRLSPIIGREAALRSVIQVAPGWSKSRIPIEDATSWTLAPMERNAIAILADDAATASEVEVAVASLFWMRDRLAQPQRVAGLLAKNVSGRIRAYGHWEGLFYSILSRAENEMPFDLILEAVGTENGGPHSLASALIENGLSRQGARMVPDLMSRGLVNGVTWPELEKVSPEIKAILLQRCREVYFAGDSEVQRRLSRFLRPNARFVPLGNSDFEAMARDQIGRMRRGEDTDVLVEDAFISGQLSEVLTPLIPELGDLLSSPKLYARERANDVLRRVVASPTNSPAMTNAIVAAIREGTDDARQFAIPIASRRRDIDRALVVSAILENVGKVFDPVTFDAMYRFVFSLVVEGVPAKTASPSISLELTARLERILSENVASDGPCSVVSAMWIARLPAISPETVKILAATMEDGSKSAAIRVAARDALLHIRDRQQPDISPSAPLIEASASSFAR